MCSDEKSLEKIAYVLASEHRKNIILFMEDRLAQLRQYDLVYNTTPSIRKGRLYSLTDSGKYVLEYIKSKK